MCDSPVYTFLNGLNPPAMAKDEAERARAVAVPPPDAGAQPTVRALMDKAEDAMEKTDFVTAKTSSLSCAA
jgi:hypothetical protein